MADENLNQAAAQDYYWQSDNENTVVENVGIVLDSLSNIVANNSLNENQFVAWAPSEEGEEKGKFELKAVSPPSPKTIEANENIILVGDGEEWTRGNAANISIENEEDNVYLNINGDLDSFCIQSINEETETETPILKIKSGSLIEMSDQAVISCNGDSRLYLDNDARFLASGLSYVNINNDDINIGTHPLFDDNTNFIEIGNKTIKFNSKGSSIEYGPMTDGGTTKPCIKLSYTENNITKSVQFSLDDLIDLKRFIGATPSNVVNNIQEMTTPDRLYFIPAEVVPVNEQGGE